MEIFIVLSLFVAGIAWIVRELGVTQRQLREAREAIRGELPAARAQRRLRSGDEQQ